MVSHGNMQFAVAQMLAIAQESARLLPVRTSRLLKRINTFTIHIQAPITRTSAGAMVVFASILSFIRSLLLHVPVRCTYMDARTLIFPISDPWLLIVQGFCRPLDLHYLPQMEYRPDARSYLKVGRRSILLTFHEMTKMKLKTA